MWITLLEKAIIKINGDSYAKLDSNPGREIYHLSGWVPEQVKFAEIPNKANLWARLLQNYNEGNIIINLGSDEKAEMGFFFLN